MTVLVFFGGFVIGCAVQSFVVLVCVLYMMFDNGRPETQYPEHEDPTL